MLSFASCLCRVNFYGRSSIGFSGVVSLISLSGCSRVALSSVCVVSFCNCVLPVGGSFVGVFSPPRVYWYSLLLPYLVCD